MFQKRPLWRFTYIPLPSAAPAKKKKSQFTKISEKTGSAYLKNTYFGGRKDQKLFLQETKDAIILNDNTTRDQRPDLPERPRLAPVADPHWARTACGALCCVFPSPR